MVAENRLDPSVIPGTGPGGRLTKEDVSRQLDEADGDDDSNGDAPPVPDRAAADRSCARTLRICILSASLWFWSPTNPLANWRADVGGSPPRDESFGIELSNELITTPLRTIVYCWPTTRTS